MDSPISTAELIVNGITNLVGSIQTLASQGARNSLVVNSADLGLIPENLGTNRQAELSLLSATFNEEVSNQTTNLQANAAHLNLDYFEIDKLFAEILDDPEDYGFSNLTDRCFTGASTCDEPDRYLFWDGSHPTTRTHQLMAEHFYETVYKVTGPAPVLGAAMALGWSRRLRGRLQHQNAQAGLSKNQP